MGLSIEYVDLRIVCKFSHSRVRRIRRGALFTFGGGAFKKTSNGRATVTHPAVTTAPPERDIERVLRALDTANTVQKRRDLISYVSVCSTSHAFPHTEQCVRSRDTKRVLASTACLAGTERSLSFQQITPSTQRMLERYPSISSPPTR